jgi:hypothetical protein
LLYISTASALPAWQCNAKVQKAMQQKSRVGNPSKHHLMQRHSFKAVQSDKANKVL